MDKACQIIPFLETEQVSWFESRLGRVYFYVSQLKLICVFFYFVLIKKERLDSARASGAGGGISVTRRWACCASSVAYHTPALKQTLRHVLKGAWCSGITSASHAEGPGLKSQCVHCFHLCWSESQDFRTSFLTAGHT